MTIGSNFKALSDPHRFLIDKGPVTIYRLVGEFSAKDCNISLMPLKLLFLFVFSLIDAILLINLDKDKTGKNCEGIMADGRVLRAL